MSSTPYVLFDIVIALLLIFSLMRGYRKGLVLTLCGFLAIFVAFIGASMVSSALAKPVSQAIRPAIETSIRKVISDNLDAPALPDVSVPEGAGGEDSGLDATVDQVLTLLKDSKFYRGFVDAFQKAVDEGLVAASANASKALSDYISLQLARIVLFCVAFVLVLIIWFFISHALDLAFKLPVLSSLNQWSGAFLGLLRGALLIYIACWLLKGSLIPQDAIASTYLLKLFCTASPMALLS